MPGRNKGAAPFGRCGAVRTFALRGWTSAQSPLHARYYDIGAIKLDCNVGQRTGWLGVEALTDDRLGVRTTVQGYAADLAPPGRQWVSEDELRVLWELKGFYQNDTYGGTSGAAVTASDQRETIIGVHTNGLHGEAPWSSNNAFTRITPERLAIIRGWITE
jgi:putative chitinase